MNDAPESTEAAEEEQPRGTFFLVLVFLVMIIVLWVWTYGVLLGRG
jgi:hypothetical protein